MSTERDETEYYKQGNKLVVLLTKELDHHNATLIKEQIDLFILSGGIRDVVFDFEETTFMDSSGIGVILGRYRMLNPISGNVYVKNMNKEIQRIFLISGLHKLVEIEVDH